MEHLRIVLMVGVASIFHLPVFSQSVHWESTDGPYRPEERTHLRFPDGDRRYYGTNTGTFRTTDDGTSWINVGPTVTSTFPDIFNVYLSPSGLLFGHLIYTDPYNHDVYVNIVYRSSDRGDHWQPSWGGPPSGGYMPEGESTLWGGMAFGAGDSTYVSYCKYNRADGSGTANIIRSTDGGMTWTTMLSIGGSPVRLFTDIYVQNSTIFAHRALGDYFGYDVRKSTDGGTTWQKIEADGVMFFAPNNLLRQRRDFLGNGLVSAKTYLELSTDDGTSWTQVLTADSGFASLVSDDVQILLALRKPDLSLFRSTDAGHSWTSLGSAPAGDPLTWLHFYGKVHVLGSTKSGAYYRSTDYGTTWIQILDTEGKPLSGALQSASDSLLVVADWRGNWLESDDAGATWRSITCPLDKEKITSLLSLPSGSLLAGGAGPLYRISEGQRWSSISQGGGVWPPYMLGGVMSLSYRAGGYFMAGEMEGKLHNAYNSETYARLWRIDTAFSASGFQTIGSGNGNISCIYMAANGSVLFGAGQEIRDQLNFARLQVTAGSFAAIVEDSSHILWAGNDSLGLYKSPDTGLTWDASNAGLSNLHVLSMTVSPGGAIFAGTRGGGVFRSTDNGATWMSSGLSSDTVQSLLAGTSSVLYAGTTRGVFASTDAGGSWSDISLGLANTDIRALAEGADGTIYCGTWGAGVYRLIGAPVVAVPQLVFPPNHTVFYGGPFTFTWRQVGGALSYHLQSSTDSLFQREIFLNDSTLTDTMRSSRPTDSTFNMSSGGLYYWRVRAKMAAGWSEWSAPWAYILSPCGVADEVNTPKVFALEQNYPNPFNPSTVIKYTVGGTRDCQPASGLAGGLGVSDISLVVFDVLGRSVATLVNERKLPGTYEVTFDGSALSSGVYFYRLQAGSFVQTMAMLLVK
jgi:photosystem II stability/assembly factor-like uncharacterized protein